MRNKVLHIFSSLLLAFCLMPTVHAQTSGPTPEQEENGIGGYKPQSRIKIAGNVYGGGDEAAVLGNTHVVIHNGEFGGEIFGGGNGALNNDGTVRASADIGTYNNDGTLVEGTGDTHVTINGGEIVYYIGTAELNSHNIYGGGNLACNVAGSTHVKMNRGMITAWSFVSDSRAMAAWQSWYDNHESNKKTPVAAVFGAGFGTHTDVALNTFVDINIGSAHEGEYDKSDLETINRHIVRERPNPALGGLFVADVLGGGYNGTVGAYSRAEKRVNVEKDEYLANTHVTIQGSPYMFNVFGGGVGSKEAADADLITDKYKSRVGAVFGGTKIDIQGGFIYGSVFGGGAGIDGGIMISQTVNGHTYTGVMPYVNAAQVFRETDVTIRGSGAVIIGNVYGGGDIANTGWHTAAARPSGDHREQTNMSLGILDYTTSVKLLDGNVMGQVFAGGNGRKKKDIPQAHLIGSVIGSTNLIMADGDDATIPGTTVWSNIYGGGNAGRVYSCADIETNRPGSGSARTMVNNITDGCTNVAIFNGKVAQDLFAGGLGDVSMVDADDNPSTPDVEQITSADISGNTYIYIQSGTLEWEKYWDAASGTFKNQSSAVADRNTASDICHNLYGGGNIACIVEGNSHVYMAGAPKAPLGFNTSQYWMDCVANVAKPHFSAFGGGFGANAKILGNAYSDINLNEGSGFHSIIGGGMNGPVVGTCQVHIGSHPTQSIIHYVYGGGYYAPCGGTKLEITRGYIASNVFGGAVMGNINVKNGANPTTDIATRTIIGLKEGTSIDLKDEGGTILRSYAYSDHKNQITIGGNVYGGNDVSGTVNGIASLTIYGGTVKGDVFGAGNGDHIGYYVPNDLLYDLGAHGTDNYYFVNHGPGYTGNTYVGRPQTTGGVEVTLEGNSVEERVRVLGQVFGGGNSCTIGTWDKDLLASYGSNPHLTRDDPNYFLGGGKIDMNLGSHISIGRTHKQLSQDADGEYYLSEGENVSGLYMGCSGRHLATQDGAVSNNYYHHYYDAHAQRYYPGFAVADEFGNTMVREEQLKPFQAYLNNIMVWSDNVHLNISEEAEDIWLANFVGGGFRGSMRTQTLSGKFDYYLPQGVTVSHTIVGGAYNSHVKYHSFEFKPDGSFVDADGDGIYDYATEVPEGWVLGRDYLGLLYEDKEHPEKVTGILRYNFNGGMLSENSTGVADSEVGSHIHQVHADPREEGISEAERNARYATSYFEPMPEDSEDPDKEDAATRAKLYTANKDKVLLHLDLRCALEPEVLPLKDSDRTRVHGGNVFGGCFMSGYVEGDSWVDYNCWLSPTCSNNPDPDYAYYFDKRNNMHIYDEVSDIENNNAMSVYGAGFGTDTHSMGDVYLYIKSIAAEVGGDSDPTGKFPYMFNAFGGSNMGTVEGNTNVYYAVGQQGTLLGSLYGGSFQGDIEGNTFVEMAEGFATNVYGGSRQADIKGASHVWAYDGFYRGLRNANHLIICNLYGGNDIAGIISGTMPATFTSVKWGDVRGGIDGKQFNTYVEISSDSRLANRGFPLIGSVFAGGNGVNWTNQDGNKPEVETALLEIDGGSTLRAFGGGNMATVTKDTYIFTNAESDRFADVTFTEYQKNIVQKVFFGGAKSGFKWNETRMTMDPFHVVRLFGGNNLATMDIQPTWNLKKGKIENVYSGGNMGDMTYYNPNGNAATRDGQIGSPAGVEVLNSDGSNGNYSPRGLSITIDSPDIYINSLFGGCRMSDVIPTPKDGEPAWPEGADGEDFYGATVNITDGYIENVYGGNDISGTVYHGTNVNISGAVSGNVYGSGNGCYLYKYDENATTITEELDDEFGLHFVVPERDREGNLYDIKGVPGSETHKLLTINNIRPSVEKAFLNISGLENYRYKDGSEGKRVAYVKGNVFCGGNASTIIEREEEAFTKFKLGSYVTLNGIFMGCDGYSFSQNDHIAAFAQLNGFSDMGGSTEFNRGFELDASHNPIMLNAYMMAVDMEAQPKDFILATPLHESHIGTFCGGGNRGSMLVDAPVTLPFPHDVVIFDKIVGACLDANVTYNQNGTIIKSQGGYTRRIADNATFGNTKLKLDVASQFVPLVMDVPDDKHPSTLNQHGETFETAKAHGFLYDNRTVGVKYTFEEFNDLFETEYTSQEEFEEHEGLEHQWKEAPGIYAPSCNIYGGCYQSGEVEGDVEINLHSSMLRYVDKNALNKSIDENIACFNVYGAGFGQDSHVWGNIRVNMDRSLDETLMGEGIGRSTISDYIKTILQKDGLQFDVEDGDFNKPYGGRTGLSYDCSYPSVNNLIGGGRNGKLIGNTTIEIRNGLVYSDVAGGCYASDMYGSSQIIVGYPKYYECTVSGDYSLDRADKWNNGKKDIDGNELIKQSVKYIKGDLVPENVYQQIVSATAGNASHFRLVDIQPRQGKNTSLHTLHVGGTDTYDGTTWDDILIKIGKGIYGGGYSLANSTAASAGSYTTHRLTDTETTDLHKHNFDQRWGYDDAYVGYGGNSSVMVSDMDASDPSNAGFQEHDHIRISKLKATPVSVPSTGTIIGKFVLEPDGSYTHQGDGTPQPGVQYYELSGDGGIYGDGHLTFCEAFRTADITRYGYADGTAKHPILMNTFQRMDLLSVNDCCLMLQGAQDFASDQIDATVYSITRINELRMNSSIDASATLGNISSPNGLGGVGLDFDRKQQRNYLAFFNNVHYLGALVTNDDFSDSQQTFHDSDGSLGTQSYRARKNAYIEAYNASDKDAAATTAFKKRNVGTARNAIGVNNGFCLRVQNQEYVDTGDLLKAQTYYGPIVGVCEIKLLTLVQGEGGGYVYADNIHADENHFLNTSGNFVFPGVVGVGSFGDQYIVDDCFLRHFGTTDNITEKVGGELDESHYWYVEGNRYFFNTTLTAYTYQEALDFNLIENDPNIILSGMENGSQLNIKKIEWLGNHRSGYQCVLENNEVNKIDDYEFDIDVCGRGEGSWISNMPRYTAGGEELSEHLTSGLSIGCNELPQFNIRLQDKLDNSGDAAYVNHLDEPEVIKIYLEGKTKDEYDNWMTYDYTITLNVVYLQGPTFEGGVDIQNCALPGERIGFSSGGIKIKTPEVMPITASSWQILPLKEIDMHGEYKWDYDNGIVIPESMYSEDLEGHITGSIPALYKQNEYNIAFIFTAGGHNFPVMPNQKNPLKQQRMIVIHNYHRMKDVLAHNLQVEKMPEVYDLENASAIHASPEAKLYIEDEEDLRAFVDFLNRAEAGNTYNIPVGLGGLDIILQKDIQLSADLSAIRVPFAGTLHGDGHHIDLAAHGTTLFGNQLVGKVYNLGLIGGTIASSGEIINSYEYNGDDAFADGSLTYALSHTFNPTSDHDNYDDYVAGYYANGDYQYATTDRVWSLRTGAPNYDFTATHHDCNHTHDAARWMDADSNADVDILNEVGQNVPLYDGTMAVADRIIVSDNGLETTVYSGLPVLYANDYLFFGQHLDVEHADAYAHHIEPVATGDTYDDGKGGNRVYETSGYYHSNQDRKFYYNSDAWAMDVQMTAVDFSDFADNASGRTPEGDGAMGYPSQFSKLTVDEKLHPETGAGITNNLLVYSWLAADATDNPFALGVYGADMVAENIAYHTIDRDNHIGNFHLVDNQCFNAPVSFGVTGRAWYERIPDRWRNVGINGYQNTSAWEGICLPFTARRVSASENIELSHFYGEEPSGEGVLNDRTLHHEYWLTGLVQTENVDAKNISTFARPSMAGDHLFVDILQNAAGFDYTYPKNDYFSSLINYSDYHDDNYDDADGQGDEWVRSDAEWYQTPHTYADYVPLTASVPYLIAFPGNDFYEFSLEGQNYDRTSHTKNNLHQIVTFENTGLLNGGEVTVGVSDLEAKQTKVGESCHFGTYMDLQSDAVVYGINAVGSEFEAGSRVAPFRTGMTLSDVLPQSRSISISDGYLTEVNEDPENPEEKLDNAYLRVWNEGCTIVVETSDACDLNVFAADGVLRCVLYCQVGQNRFPMSSAGIYLVGKYKLQLNN